VQQQYLKTQPEGRRTGDTLFASPVWVASAPDVAQSRTTFAQHHVVLFDLPQVAAGELQSRIPGCRCVAVPASPSATIAQRYADAALACLDAIGGLLRDKPQGACLVQLVAADRDAAQMVVGLSGLIETAALENPGVIGQIVLVDADVTTAEVAQRIDAEHADPRVGVVRYAGDVRSSRRWQLIDAPHGPEPIGCAFKEHGVYLITGGLGGLGVLVAQDILARTANAKIVLAGRAAATGGKRAALEALRRTGRVEYRQADVADAV
jgi:KR domain-containing protein